MSDQLKEYRIVISLAENETVSCALYEEKKMLGGKGRARFSELSSGLDAHLSRLEEGVGNNRRQNRSPEPPPDRSGDLEAAGEKLWELLFAKGPGEALLEILENAEENGPVALRFQLPEQDSYRFHRIPWHALRAPGRLPVALMKNVARRGFVGKRRVDGNQTILVWNALASRRRHIRDTGPELEALVTFTAPYKSAMNQLFEL